MQVEAPRVVRVATLAVARARPFQRDAEPSWLVYPTELGCVPSAIELAQVVRPGLPSDFKDFASDTPEGHARRILGLIDSAAAGR